MPQSHSQVIVHLIFSTRNRAPLLGADLRPRLHAYLAVVCRDLHAEAFRVGGVVDHVYLLATLPRTLSQADFVEALKKTSSKWAKTLAEETQDFSWQRGYGVFSVSPSQSAAVARYIENQEEHHRHHTFQEEYREFLRRHGLAFDERYVWD